jgi:hypothetical protein
MMDKTIILYPSEIESVIEIREDKTYCTFQNGYKIVVTKVDDRKERQLED